MKLRSLYKPTLVFVICLTVWLSGCSTENTEDDIPNTGTLDITVRDASDDSLLPGVQLLVFAGEDDAPVADTLLSDSEGKASLTLDVGVFYYLRASAQGFESSPPPELPETRFTVSGGQTTFSTIRLKRLTATGNGYLSGTISDVDAAGALVVANTGGAAHSTKTDASGNYTLFNLPADTYSVSAWIANFSSDSVSAAVNADAETTNVDLTLSAGPGSEVSGTLTFDTSSTTEATIQLIHPLTAEAIPGLSIRSEQGSYTIPGVADGTYLARASFENDGVVMAPDWLAQNGQPQVSISAAPATQDFTLTQAAAISGPSNNFSNAQPAIVQTLTPSFTWPAFTDATDYVIEVSDLDGNVLWGGFGVGFSTRNFVIPADTLSVTYNDPGVNADGVALEDGKMYRWRLYVSQYDVNNSWQAADLVTVSEDQLGLFKIVLPQP